MTFAGCLPMSRLQIMICKRGGWINGVQGSLHDMLDKIKGHEKSNMHLQASAAYMGWKVGKDFGEKNEHEIGRQESFWAKVLQRLISNILTMTTLTLAFRGHREQVHDNICEGGNFLALVSLMAEYDEFLAEVISLPGRATKYLSAKIQNELIHLLANTVSSTLVENINSAPFWSIILDSTSDITRVDQLSVVIRWAKVTEDECTIVESFMGFLKISNPNADGIARTAKAFLENLGIDFSKLRGQGYDGASVMSGIHGGVQKLIKGMVKSSVPFVHCGCHNPNLIVNHAATSLATSEKFFATLRDIICFLALPRIDSEISESKLRKDHSH